MIRSLSFLKITQFFTPQSVDYATDELIGRTIRQYVIHPSANNLLIFCSREFSDSTIITIAHRLRTVVDYNRVSD